MTPQTGIRSNSVCDLRIRARELVAQAEALAAEITALHDDIQAAGRESVRAVGFRCDTSAGWVRESAGYLRDTARDLEHIESASAPGGCCVPWGACPDHGNTLTSTGGRSWCCAPGCGQAWDYDRISLPCTEPARWAVTDQHGGCLVMCEPHAFDARERIDGAELAPLASDSARRQA